MKLKELYYRFKYRQKKGADGATAFGIIRSDKSVKNVFDERLDNIAKNSIPCYKTNREVLEYIKSKYELKIKELTDIEINNYKINFLLGRHPEFLKTPKEEFSGKAPSRKEFLKFSEQSEKRFEEARNYPVEKLGLEIEGYTFDYLLEDGFVVKFEVTAENTYDDIVVGFSVINRTLSKEEEKILRSVSDEIRIYKGVTKEDIENKTAEFIIYAAALINKEEKQ